MLLRGVVVGALVVGSLAACSTDPRELDSGEVRQLLVRGMEEDDGENAVHFTKTEAECTADRVMDDISTDRLKELGVDEGFGLSALDFTPAEEDVVFGALQACLDMVSQVADTLGTDSGLSEADARCMAERYVASPVFREAIASKRFDPALNERIDAALAQAAQACDAAGRTIPS